MLQPRWRIDRDEPSITAMRGVQQDMWVQLRVRNLIGNGASGGVPPARRGHPDRLGMQNRVRVQTLAQHRYLSDREAERAADRRLVRGLGSLTQLR
jgi:hypothetical protein